VKCASVVPGDRSLTSKQYGSQDDAPQSIAILDPFFTTKSAGGGLGLAVVQEIVRSLGGAIHLASESDNGTTFLILPPSANTTAATSVHVKSGDEHMAVPTQHGTVLVVEDEDYLRQGIVKMLSKTGFEVFDAADGSSAIKLLHVDGGKSM
jgi:two-component system cell cycle sensor histidine kinase/response regulator CckA